jgi:tetratricopeptide (TPR) repeat protein
MKRILKNILPVLLIAMAFAYGSGCAMPSPGQRSRSAVLEAQTAETQGNWQSAAASWQRAINIEQGIWKDPERANSPKRLAMYYYELGRSLGALGRYDESERALHRALRLDQKYGGPMGMDYAELARLYHTNGYITKSASCFHIVMQHLDEVDNIDPAEYLAVVNEAAVVAKASGDSAWAEKLEAKAKNYSTAHPNLTIPGDWTPYKKTE